MVGFEAWLGPLAGLGCGVVPQFRLEEAAGRPEKVINCCDFGNV